MLRRIARALPTLLAVFCLGGAVSCAPASDDAAGVDAFPQLADGVFFPDAVMLDVPSLFFEEREVRADISWRLPTARGILVEEVWGGPEDWGAWGLGESTRVRFYVRRMQPFDVYVEGMAPPDPEGREQRVTALVNGREIGERSFNTTLEARRWEIPEDILKAGANELELRYAYDLGGTLPNDDRALAFGFKRLGLLPREEDPRSGPALRVYRDQEILVFDDSGSYVFPLRLGETTSGELEFEFRSSLPEGAEARFEVAMLDLADGLPKPLENLSETPERPRFSVDRGGASDLVLLVDVALPEGGRFTLGEARLFPAQTGDAEAADGAGKTAPPIVLIILDAARADHFGVYGHDRDTTPHIDRLASESLVYRQAISECPYTLCAMPSLLSGLSFVEHGLVSHDLLLEDAVVTLAERLAEEGYATIGYTGNPNNSRVTGTQQGFEVYREIWETHPGPITDEALTRLEAGTGDRPFFLMLHYVPPHEPYDPDPDFDVFGNPGYAGPVTSDRQFALDVYAQRIELDEADLYELVSLYDGNLKMADAAVGEVIDTLKRLGLYDESLIIVTSDHGEAFMEHGRVGHNTTLYDEMLHVPMIVKLPVGIETVEEVDTERLVTLADVIPTVHRLLGLAPPDDAVDLLASEPPAERVLFLRSGDPDNPLLGVRTGRFKAITRVGRPPELYDLVADPDETIDLAAERPLLHTGLILLLERALAEPAPFRAGRREGELSEEDRKQLETLGYL